MINKQQQLKTAMEWLAAQEKVVFVGQNIKFPKNQMYDSLIDIPRDKMVEFPVAEDFQMGFSIGMALAGNTVVTLYPRFDFLLLATNQLVNHLNNFEYLYKGNFYPRVIIRTMVGGTAPLNPGKQHTKDGTEAYKLLCDRMSVRSIPPDTDFVGAYQLAYYDSREKPVLMVEQ